MTIKKGSGKADIDRVLRKLISEKKVKGIDAYKYCGIIKLKRNPEDIQKEIRSEWD